MRKINCFKKALSVAFAFTMLAAAACGGGGTGEAGGESSTSTNGGNQQVVIRVGDKVTSNQGLEGVRYNRQLAFDAANPNIKVIHEDPVVKDSTKTTQQITEEIGTEDACVLMTTTAANYARSLYQMGLVEDWSKYLTEAEIETLNPNVAEALTSASGALTGFPTSLETPLIGFNRDHLRSEYVRKAFLGDNYNVKNAVELVEAELDKIVTWADYKEALVKLTGKYVVDFNETDVSGYGGYYTDFYLGIGMWLISNGYGISTQNADYTINVDMTETSTVETIEFLQGLAQEGITKVNTGVGFQEFYNLIFQNKIASFIYYPSWAAWFQGNSMYADDIKVINMPIGPSAQARIENGEDVNTNPSFSVTCVMNKNATEEQKKAAAKYMLYMYSYEAVEENYEYMLENDIENFTMPALKFDDAYWTDTILANAPADWSTKIMTAKDNLFVLKPDTDVWRTYISSDVPTMIKKDSDYRGDALIARLGALNSRIKTEWLDFYNSKFKK